MRVGIFTLDLVQQKTLDVAALGTSCLRLAHWDFPGTFPCQRLKRQADTSNCLLGTFAPHLAVLPVAGVLLYLNARASAERELRDRFRGEQMRELKRQIEPWS